jgi:biopolymer transport protein ExbB/TolQ
MTDQIVEILYYLSSGFLAPTLALLLIFLSLTVVMLGGLAREALERQLYSRPWKSFVHDLRFGKVAVDRFFELTTVGFPARIQRQVRNVTNQPRIVDKCLEDVELDIARRLSGLTFGTRLGPMLGLVGTLVPLGPALTGLASGDIQTLSGNLVIAFTTTVFGILIGGVAYAAGVVRRGWYEQDLSDLEFVAGFWCDGESIAVHASRNGHSSTSFSCINEPAGNVEHA